ncbi:MAG: hypothetical protein EAZ60_19580 [Oscillatoriales cyanobacterium]|nr:MAG: hypothetical protein EAZ83_18565 [Oscillatoriales cyanobacterium]TAF01267.1 MAG: hypothetical protein EAZ79_00475 [Oscillatoriales cyanobacterium]TAF17788.1 MAG: hypothetical protein EAZ73_19905 [Oscillatoriales cyanobacterium]TAF34545.1 MAG: hypothetical protein EAZ69_14590 [Oscillatoriales cyanobacterium]TAF53637.1 MAG: hypothetical protein EAZ60_19580 [Oscillatoriales cyanobacterium]
MEPEGTQKSQIEKKSLHGGKNKSPRSIYPGTVLFPAHTQLMSLMFEAMVCSPHYHKNTLTSIKYITFGA